MAVGTAALIVILSVYNGFDSIIRDNLDSRSPDFVVKPLQGKTFDCTGENFLMVAQLPGVSSAEGVIEETVAASYGDLQTVTRLRGIEGAIWCSVSQGLASELGIRPFYLQQLSLYFPSRSESFSIANPAASLEKISMRPGEILSLDGSTVVVPIGKARELLHLDSKVTSFEIFGEGLDAAAISELIGPGFEVLDRYRQHPAVYKMMRYEKTAIFIILIFVVLIVAFNIFGSLSMLIIDKTDDIGTLRSIGADNALVRRTFFLEGWLVSLLGLAVGLAAGILLALLQQHFGLVRMPGNMVANAYPVVLKFTDILLTAGGVALIGALVSAISIKDIKK